MAWLGVPAAAAKMMLARRTIFCDVLPERTSDWSRFCWVESRWSGRAGLNIPREYHGTHHCHVNYGTSD